MHRYRSIFLFFALLVFGVGLAVAHDPQSDEAIETQVRELLKIHGFEGESAIEVKSEEGILTLSGSVSSHEQADSILAIVSHLDGVKKINSNLVIEGSENPYDDEELETREDTIERKEDDEVPVGGEIQAEDLDDETRIRRTVRAGGRDIDADDEELAEEVEEKLRELEFTEDATIEVSIEDGIVTLTGSVEDRDEADAMLVELAKIDGVEEVRANLTVVDPDETVEELEE